MALQLRGYLSQDTQTKIKVKIMNKLQKSVGCLLLASSIGGVQASTLDAEVGVNINDFDVFVAGGNTGGTDKTVAHVNQFNFTGFALSDFGAGTSAPNVVGSIFKDYIVVSGTSLLDSSGTPIGGNQLTNNWELTAVLEATGEITSIAGAFKFLSLDSFDMYVDAIGDSSGGITNANFAGSLANFEDGTKVITGGPLVSLTSTTPPNVGALNPTLGANGEFNVQFEWFETVAAFLRETGTTTSLFDVFPNILSLTAGEVTLQATNIDGIKAGNGANTTEKLAKIAIMDNFRTYFGVVDGGSIFLTQVSTTPDANLASVPEPNIVLLMGVGLLGLASSAVRRKKTV
jgi:hypothetical protein